MDLAFYNEYTELKKLVLTLEQEVLALKKGSNPKADEESAEVKAIKNGH